MILFFKKLKLFQIQFFKKLKMLLSNLVNFKDIKDNIENLVADYDKKFNNNETCNTKDLENAFSILQDILNIYTKNSTCNEELLKTKATEKINIETKRLSVLAENLLNSKIDKKMKKMSTLKNVNVDKVENTLKEMLNYISNKKQEIEQSKIKNINKLIETVNLETEEKIKNLEKNNKILQRIINNSLEEDLECEKIELLELSYKMDNLIEKITLKNKIIGLKDKKRLFDENSKKFSHEISDLQIKIFERSRVLSEKILQHYDEQLLIKKNIAKCNEESLLLQKKYINFYENLLENIKHTF